MTVVFTRPQVLLKFCFNSVVVYFRFVRIHFDYSFKKYDIFSLNVCQLVTQTSALLSLGPR